MSLASDEERELATRNLILFGLLEKRGQVYAGTVPAHVKARRRARDKVARESRRRNRGR